MAFLTDQPRRILKSWYTGEGPEHGVSSVAQAKKIVLCKGFAILKQGCFLTFLLKKYKGCLL